MTKWFDTNYHYMVPELVAGQRLSLNASKIVSELNWQPRYNFDTGLRDTVRWYLENRTWWERVRSGVYRGERLGVAV